MPLVSIIMGVHNGANRITKAVDSMLAQTYSDFELIICDDCSSDATFDILNVLKQKDSRIKILRNDHNRGLSASLNYCLKHVEGKYIARMDDDDYSHPNRIETQFRFMEAHPEYAVVGTGRNTVDSNGVWNTISIEGELFAKDIISGRIFTHPTVMMRYDALKFVDGYTVSKRTMRGQDFDLWCKMYAHGFKGYLMKDVLFDYYEDRNAIKEIRFKYRFNNFKTHMMWRKKMSLPFRYDIYAWKEILAGILPLFVLVWYKQKRHSRNE